MAGIDKHGRPYLDLVSSKKHTGKYLMGREVMVMGRKYLERDFFVVGYVTNVIEAGEIPTPEKISMCYGGVHSKKVKDSFDYTRIAVHGRYNDKDYVFGANEYDFYIDTKEDYLRG